MSTPPAKPARIRSKWRRRLSKLILVLAALFVASMLSEGIARLYLGYRSGWTTFDGSLTVEGSIGDYDPDLGYAFTPGAKARIRGPEYDFSININSAGFRMDREVTTARPPGKKRIVVVGDSFTFGHGIPVGSRYPDILENHLLDVEVVNTAVWGSGTDQQLLLYRKKGSLYDADLVVLGFLVENIVRNGSDSMMTDKGSATGKPQFVLVDDKLSLRNVPVPRELMPVSDDQRDKAAARGTGIPIPFKDFLRRKSVVYNLVQRTFSSVVYKLAGKHSNPYPEYDSASASWQVTRRLFHEFQLEASNHGAAFAVVVIPTIDYVRNPNADLKPFGMIAEACREYGIDVLDLRDRMVTGGTEAYFTIDQHWSQKGHVIAADALAEFLAEHHPWCRRVLRR